MAGIPSFTRDFSFIIVLLLSCSAKAMVNSIAFQRLLTLFMKAASPFTIEELFVESLLVYEKVRSGQTCDELRAKFALRYNQAASTESSACKSGLKTFLTCLV
jgi:hypothetical protein